jgi:folate-binding protein YgfZ
MSALPIQPVWNVAAVERLAREVGGVLRVDACGPGIDVGAASLPEGDFLAPLCDLGIIGVSGEAAAAFLHGQLTNDVEHLLPGMARWAGYCSAKGRLLSTMRYWRDDQTIWLTSARPLAQLLTKRLSMYVLRAKAKVTDHSDVCVVFGLCGEALASFAAKSLALRVPGPDEAFSNPGVHLVGLPGLTQADGGFRPRWLLIVPADQAGQTWQTLQAVATPVASEVWRRTEVLCAIPRIVPGSYEQFVPQMINFESVDGINFRKGCYPGQEIVARSQYLGKLKRRMFLACGRGDAPEPGSDILAAAGGEPCGQVVLAASDGSGGFDVLFESQLSAIEAGGVRAGTTSLSLGNLPYLLKAIE